MRQVIGALDFLPLALDQAGAYIRSKGGNVSFQTFLDHFDQRKKEILEHLPRFWPYKDYGSNHEQAPYQSIKYQTSLLFD